MEVYRYTFILGALILQWPSRSLGSVVQSIVSLTSSLRGQLVKYVTPLLLNTLKFFVEKMREALALQKLLTLFQQKYWQILDTLTNDVVSFE